jgi:hypothetical protein
MSGGKLGLAHLFAWVRQSFPSIWSWEPNEHFDSRFFPFKGGPHQTLPAPLAIQRPAVCERTALFICAQFLACPVQFDGSDRTVLAPRGFRAR